MSPPDYGLQVGDVPGGPPVNLPTFDQPPPPRPTVVVTPNRTNANGDPYADLKPWSLPEGKEAAPPSGDPYGDLKPWKSSDKATDQPQRQVGMPEALGRGAIESASFGFAPELAGIAQAGGEGTHPAIYDIAKFLENEFSSHPDPEVKAAYERGRNAMLEDQRAAQEQHSGAYLGGQIVGAMAGPAGEAATARLAARVGLPTIARTVAPSAVGRIGQGIGTGATGGALYGAGEATSEGKSPGEVALEAGKGAVTGALFGGTVGTVAEGTKAAASRIGDLVRGSREPEAEAARRVVEAIQSDIQNQGGPGMGPQEIAAARAAGTPSAVMDVGGERTRALARSAANTSPEAREALTAVTDRRYEQQAPRIANFIRGMVGRATVNNEPQGARIAQAARRLVGGTNATAIRGHLQEAARKANRPAYTRAYEAGDRDIWSPRLEQLSAAPSILSAMRKAESKWKDWQVVDGFGAANPPVKIDRGGILKFQGGGLRTYPNIQYWDYVARNIADRAESARRAGRMELARRLGELERGLKAELDRIVPEFKKARVGASEFFDAQDALGAGQNFVTLGADIGEARKALADMSPPERELFAHGYISNLADKLERSADTGNVLDSALVSSPAARQKMELAVGPQRAAQFERSLNQERIWHTFAGARNPIEAGANFVMGMNRAEDLTAARRSMAAMNPQERELFAQGFASELANRVEGVRDRASVLNQIFIDTPRARQKIDMALGTDRAQQFEALLRVEALIDRQRTAVQGNSTTVRQLQEMGHAGGKAVAGFEALRELVANPVGAIVSALTLGAARRGAQRIDENVARHVGEMLASEDPATLKRGLAIVTKNSTMWDNLRSATGAVANPLVRTAAPRVAAHRIGLEGTIAGAIEAAPFLHGHHGSGHGEASHDDLLDRANDNQ